jgi:type II secretory pathway pseudopilin PulG
VNVALLTAIIGLASTLLGLLVKWYFDKNRQKADELAAQKKAQLDAEQAAQEQKKNQQTINDSIRKQVDAADKWNGSTP